MRTLRPAQIEEKETHLTPSVCDRIVLPPIATVMAMASRTRCLDGYDTCQLTFSSRPSQ